MIGLIGLIANDYHHSELHRNGAAQQQQHTKQNEVVLAGCSCCCVVIGLVCLALPCLPFFYHLPLFVEIKRYLLLLLRFEAPCANLLFDIWDYHLLLDAQSHQSSSVNQCASSSSYFPLLIRLGWEKTELQFGERSWRYRFLPVFSFTMLLLLLLQLTLATLFTLFFHSFDYVCLLCVLPVCALCGIVCYLGNSRCTMLLID